MKVFVTYRGGELAELRERVRQRDALAVSGVLVGTRTGWRREELEAIGLGMPSFRTPMDRLKNPRRWHASCSTRARPTLEGSQVVAARLSTSQ